MLKALGNRPATRLIPHLADFSSYKRGATLKLLAESEKVGIEARDAFLAWISDGSRSATQPLPAFKNTHCWQVTPQRWRVC
jgi:hypothetical protein